MVSSVAIPENTIGEVFLTNKIKNVDVENLLKSGKREYIYLNTPFFNLCTLPNNRLLSSQCDIDETGRLKQTLAIYDENYFVVKKYDVINGENIHLDDICINEENEMFYILNIIYHRITVTDFEMNFIEYFGSKGEGNNEFNYPKSLCFKNECLYVSDSCNKRIQIFNEELELINSLKLDESPDTIKVSSAVICIKFCTDSTIHFYNLHDLSFHKKFDNVFRINEINSNFFLLNFESLSVTCHDAYGNLKEEIFVEDLSRTTLDYEVDGSLLIFKETLLINLYSQEKIIKISKN